MEDKMKKRLLAVLMAATMSMALIACGGGEEAATTQEGTVEVAVEEDAAEEAVVEEVTEEATAEEEMSPEEILKSVFTGAIVGADEEENTYWFLFDDELTYGAFVILSADYTTSINVVGEITSRDEDGALVITDESTSSYIAFTVVEEGEDYLVVQIEDGNQVTLINYDLDEAIETVVGIDQTTEIIE